MLPRPYSLGPGSRFSLCFHAPYRLLFWLKTIAHGGNLPAAAAGPSPSPFLRPSTSRSLPRACAWVGSPGPQKAVMAFVLDRTTPHLLEAKSGPALSGVIAGSSQRGILAESKVSFHTENRKFSSWGRSLQIHLSPWDAGGGRPRSQSPRPDARREACKGGTSWKACKPPLIPENVVCEVVGRLVLWKAEVRRPTKSQSRPKPCHYAK